MSKPLELEIDQSMHDVSGYINAGGLGTRLHILFPPDKDRGLTKALLAIGNPPLPMVDHQINKLSRAHIGSIVAGIGTHHNVGRHLERVYAYDKRVNAVGYGEQLGNGGDLIRSVRDYPEYFKSDTLIVNVDTLLDIDEQAFLNWHKRKSAGLTIALTENEGVPNEGAYYVGINGEVVYCDETIDQRYPGDNDSKPYQYRASSTGAIVIKTDLLHSFNWKESDGPISLYRDIVARLMVDGNMFAFNNGNRLFIDIGTVASWMHVTENIGQFQPYLIYSDQQTTSQQPVAI